MKRNLTYTGLIFVLLLLWMVFGMATQYLMGAYKGEDLPIVLSLAVGVPAVLSIMLFALLHIIRKGAYSSPAEKGYRPTWKFAAIAGPLVVASIAGSIWQFYSMGEAQLKDDHGQTARKAAIDRAAAAHREQEAQRLAAMTPQQREADAKQKAQAAVDGIIQEGEAVLKRWREREAWAKAKLAGVNAKEPNSKPVTGQEWTSAVAHLHSIKPDHPQYQKAHALLAAMNDEDKKAATTNVALASVSMIDQRDEFAKKLEEILVDKRMDADVSAGGSQKTTLTIKWALANKVSVNDLSKSGVINTAEKTGFKKVIFTDGYEFSWQWDLHPTP